jgi:hypothetical protein
MSLSSHEIYLCYNALNVYIFVGRQCDPSYLAEVFEVDDLRQININRSEETIFSADRLASSPYLTNLYGLIN